MKKLVWNPIQTLCLLAVLVSCTPMTVRKTSSLQHVTLSLRKLTCQGCGARVVRVLKQQNGVEQARFDKHKVEVSISYKQKKVTNAQLIRVIQDMGFEALVGSGKGAYKPPVKFESSMDVKWIAKKGEAVQLAKHVVQGKVTVFDFYAVWCGPCKDVDHALFRLLQKHPKIALRKINVVDWNRPVVKQHLAGVSQLPYLIIFDQKGQKRKTIVGRKISQLQQTLKTLLTP